MSSNSLQPEKLSCTIHKKGWGREEWIVNNELYCLKFLVFDANGRGSLHFHREKDETWYVSKGSLRVETVDFKTGDQSFQTISEGDILRIPPLVPHRLIASCSGATIIEVSTPHKEEDSYRLAPGDSQKE